MILVTIGAPSVRVPPSEVLVLIAGATTTPGRLSRSNWCWRFVAHEPPRLSRQIMRAVEIRGLLLSGGGGGGQEHTMSDSLGAYVCGAGSKPAAFRGSRI